MRHDDFQLPDWLNLWKGGGLKTILKILFQFLFIVGINSVNFLKRSDAVGRFFIAHRTLIGGILAGIAGAFFLLALFSFDAGTEKSKLEGADDRTWPKKLAVGARLVVLVFLISALGVVSLYFYVGLIYSKLPQSLGGVRPRCAFLDIQKEGLSDDTLRGILPEATQTPIPTPSPMASPDSGQGIVRSQKVDVLFSGSDYILIRTESGVYEIKRDLIHAVRSCE
jgi:hypothetical protein